MSVCRLGSTQSTCQLIFQAALQQSGAAVPPKLAQVMHANLVTGINAHASANKVLAQLAKALGERGIKPVLLKGQGIASYYATPYLRQCGDIDLYVGEAAYEEACNVLEGIIGAPGVHGSKHCQFDYGHGLSIEIHQQTETLESRKLDAFYQQISNAGTSEGLVPVHFGDIDVLTPEDTFNAFYIFHHFWHHVMGMGIGMRQLCDWTVFLHTHIGKLDEARLGAWLDKFRLKEVWRVLGCLAVDTLGLEPEAVPFLEPADEKLHKKAAAFLEFVLEEGDNRDYKFGRDKSAATHKTSTFLYILRKFAKLLPIFPGQAFSYLSHGISAGASKLLLKLPEKA